MFYIPDIRNDVMQRYYYMIDDFHDHDILPKLCDKYIKCGDNILDIGGNVGNHSIYFGKYCNPNHIFTFEPARHTFDILKKNVALNGLDDIITCYNFALGEESSYGNVVVNSRSNSGSNSVVKDRNGDVKIISLDSLSFPVINFVKIDVEGFEYNVLLGAKELLKREHPVIFIEIFKDNFQKVDILLNQYGYHSVDEEFIKHRHDYIYIKM